MADSAVVTAADGAYMPQHPPANMLDLFMTRYDYDYNRDPGAVHSGDAGDGSMKDADAWMSGEVRNRPPFSRLNADWEGNTTYRVDYTAKNRRAKDLGALVRSAVGVQDGEGSEGNGSVFTRDWYRPDLTKDLENGHPISVYKTDYTNSGHIPQGQNTLYAGATNVPYKPELLHAHGALEDDGADIAPKITSKESLLPRYPELASRRAAGERPHDGDGDNTSQHTGCGLLPHDLPTDYWCTSWTYGDTSLAHPNQLPQGLEGSLCADLLGTMDDKAALLRLLAGKGIVAAKKPPFPIEDDTNPIFLSRAQQETCAVTHRVRDEGHVKQTIYASDFIDQGRLPELPGNHPESDVCDTNLNYTSTVGEMTAGTLTKYVRSNGSLRNSHGTLKKSVPESLRDTMHPSTLATMRAEEKASSIDKADPHRHKLQ